VKALIGGKAARMRLGDVDAAVCTIESASAMVNRCLLQRAERREDALSALRCVVVDEAHAVEGPRGAVLETMLAKLQAFAWASRAALTTPTPGPATPAPRSLQIVAMSATLPGVDVMARWLGASLFRGDLAARPRPIRELVLRRGHALTPFLRDADVPWRPPGRYAPAPTPPPGRRGQGGAASGGSGRRLAPSGSPAAAASPRTPVTPRPAARHHGAGRDPDGWMELAVHAARRSIPTLVFCPTKKQCQACAVRLAGHMARAGSDPPPDGPAVAEREEACRLIIAADAPAPPELVRCVKAGVAFHHGDLGNEARKAVEGAFRRRAVHVVFATSTLANGVNLPADWVVFRTPYIGGRRVHPAEFTQMSGRAGRGLAGAQGREALSVVILDTCESCGVGRGFRDDVFGAVVRAARALDGGVPLPRFLEQLRGRVGGGGGTADAVLGVLGLMTHRLPPLRSGLDREDGAVTGSPVGLRRLVLEAVATGLASGPHGLLCVLRRTLYWAQDVTERGRRPAGGRLDGTDAVAEPLGPGAAAKAADLGRAVTWLVRERLLETCPPALARSDVLFAEPEAAAGVALRPTRLGTASVASSMPPEEAVRVVADLERARHEGLSMHCGGLHAVFFLTPIFRTQAPDRALFAEWADSVERGAVECGPESEEARLLEIARRVGVTPESIRAVCRLRAAPAGRAAAGAAARAGPSDESLLVHRRFWSALVLHALASSADPLSACRRFRVQPGSLGRLQEDSGTFCVMVLGLCTQLGWTDVRLALGAYADLIVGAGRDEQLGALMRVDGVTNATAKALAAAGLEGHEDLAAADPGDVATALADAAEFLGEVGSARAARLTSMRDARCLIAAAARLHRLQSGPERSTWEAAPAPAGSAAR